MTASTAHGDGVDLASVATAVDTLVVLMAAGTLGETCRTLVAAGRPRHEPAALVQWATTEDERRVLGTLGEIAELARVAAIGPPATLVVGDVVSLAAEIGAPAGGDREALGSGR